MNSSFAPNASKSSEACIAFGFSGVDVQITTGLLVGSILGLLSNVVGFLVGVPGNILVILAISLSHSLRHNSDLVLLQLAVCDLLVSALLQPSVLAKKIEHLVLQTPRCTTVEAVRFLLATASMGSLASQVLVGMERTVAILAPYWYKERVTPTVLFAPTACVWFASSLALILGWRSPEFKPGHILAAILVATCSLLVLVCSVFLVKVANRHENEIVAQQQQVQRTAEERKKIKRERKALWTAIYVNTAFLVSYIPISVVGIVSVTILPPQDQDALPVNMVAGSTVGFASAVNPIILYRRNSRIGQEIRKLLAMIGYHGGVGPEPAPPPPQQPH